MIKISVNSTRKIEVIDITDPVGRALSKETASGATLIFCPHTTCAVTLNEYEPDLAADFEKIIQDHYNRTWKHDTHDGNAAAHLASSLFGHSTTIPMEKGRLQMGIWQRVLLLEGNGPRQRQVWIQTP